MRLAFILGPKLSSAGHGDIDPPLLFTEQHRALTGSEGTFFQIVRTLAERGHKVIAYCDAITIGEAIPALGGATVRHISDAIDPTCDAYVAQNEPDHLRRAPANKLRVCWQQHNNFDYAEPGYDNAIDLYAALSPVHREHLVTTSKTAENKWIWIPNCLDTAFFADVPTAPRPRTLAWISSPDRGLHRLLEMWPLIRKRVPDASLRIYYRFDPWIREQLAQRKATRGSARAAFITECLRRLGREGENGVTVVGAVPNVQLIRELQQTRVLPYTCDCVAFTEGFGVAVLDALAAGCLPILSDADALGDIYREVAEVIPGKPHEHQGRWIDTIVRGLTDDRWVDSRMPRARHWAMQFTRERVAALWEDVFARNLTALPTTISRFVPMSGGTTGIAQHLTPATRRLSVDFCMNDFSVYPRYGSRGFDPYRLFDAPRGLSGTDINFFGSARALAKRGHTVRIFAPFSVEANVEGVEHLQYARFPTAVPADVSIAHYDAAALGPSGAKLNVVVQHTISIPSPDFYATGKVHVSLSPSYRNMLYLKATYAPNMPWHVLGNANDLGAFQPHAPVPGRLVFHTSPERGLHQLLQVLPEIKRRFPAAHLRFIGDLGHLPDYPQLGGRHPEIAADINAGLAACRGFVETVPRASRNAVLAELAQAVVFAYPSDPPIPCEVFPVSVLDALRAGVPVVLKPADGIEDLFASATAIVPDLQAFIDTTVHVLEDPAYAAELAARGARFAESATFARQAGDLEGILMHHLVPLAPTPAVVLTSAPIASNPIVPTSLMIPPYGGR
jgi:glycosyltransferase involved in cell wall biosynthesis